jgi:hypothetical protein
MTGREDRPELAHAGRLARELLGRTVRMARTEDQALSSLLNFLPRPDVSRAQVVLPDALLD